MRTIKKTEPRPQIGDLDSLPYMDRGLVNYEKYHRFIGQAMVKHCIALQATRGCPYNCAYCHKIWPKSHVFRSAENIIGEIMMYYRLGIRRFAIHDDIFNFNRENSLKFFKLVLREGLDIQLYFATGMRGDILATDYIDVMVEAGVVDLTLALETGSPRLQKLIGKNLNIDKLYRNMEYFCTHYPGVILELQTMLGFPTETKEEAGLTRDFIKSLHWIHFPYVHILKVYPNTDMERIALENGITKEQILAATGQAYHELPPYMPFDREFVTEYQVDFMQNYFLSKDRLLHVLPRQLEVLTEDEILQKYNSYLPYDIESFDDLLNLGGIGKDEWQAPSFREEDYMMVPDFNQKVRQLFPEKKNVPEGLNILLLDLSQFYTDGRRILYDVVEPPLGLMYVLTYLNEQLGDKVNGKIAKSRIDFDSNEELLALVKEFKPHIIGLRSLTFYKDFFHQIVSLLKEFFPNVPIIAGGPYATSGYPQMLQDPGIALAVMGEGEITFCRLVEQILLCDGKIPAPETLIEIPGLAFATKEKAHGKSEIYLAQFMEDLDELQ